MALTYGFFNSVSGDRLYTAEDISNMFRGILTDGVYQTIGDAFLVTATSGMTVKVGSGRAIVENKWVENDADTTLTLSASHVTLDRYTAIVLRKDISNRVVSLVMVDGAPASSPVRPAPVRDGVTYYDIVLAYVRVPAGATEITQYQIEDTRANTAVCGFVSAVVQQLDTEELFLQYQAAYAAQLSLMQSWFAAQKSAYDDWFETLTKDLQVNTYIHRHSMSNTLVSDSASKTFVLSFPDNYDYQDKDALEVFVNGLHLSADEYVFGNTGGVIDVTITGLKAGTVVDFVVYESKIGNPISQGAATYQYNIENVTQSNSTFTAEEEE